MNIWTTAFRFFTWRSFLDLGFGDY